MRPIRLFAATALIGVASAACSSTSEPPKPVPTSIAVSPATVTLDALGATASVTATVKDQDGNTMTGQTVSWTSLQPSVAMATASGAATTITAVANGAATVTATVDSLSAQVSVTVSQVADSLFIASGSGQNGVMTLALSDSVVARVVDANGNGVSGVAVGFAVTDPGAAVSAASVSSRVDGRAPVAWTLGTTVGAQTLTATVSGLKGSPATATATAQVPSASAIVKASRDSLIGIAGKTTNIPPTVKVEDQLGNAVAGVTVNFAVTAGGGSVVNTSAVSDTSGLASAGGWTIGSGTNTVTASASGLSSVTFTARDSTPAFNIDIHLYGDTTKFTAAAKAAFAAAKAKWETLIFGDLQAAVVNFPAAGISCDTTLPAVNETVDDVVIYAKIEHIDGAGGVLGSAGPCLIRTTGSTHPTLTVLGRMRFDSADVDVYVNSGQFADVVLHEMGHVLGYGTLWNQSPFSLLTGAGGADPYFTGEEAIDAFDRVGGTNYVAGPKVPIENTGGAGTRDGHWRESVFDKELMTGYLDVGSVNPLSIVSLGSFWDMNYLVNYHDADAYVWPAPPALRAGSGTLIEMKDDIDRGPIQMIDATGRVVRVIRP